MPLCLRLLAVRHTMSVPPKKVKKVPAPPTAGSSTGPAANTEERALGKVVVEGYTRAIGLAKATNRDLH